MPILLLVSELQAGMRLTQPLVHGPRVLLPADRALSPADVDALVKKFPRLTAHVADPVLDRLFSFTDDTHDAHVAHTAQQRVASLLSGVEGQFADQMSVTKLDIRSLHETIGEVIQYLNDNSVVAAMVPDHNYEGHYLSAHPANVLYLSLMIGNAVRTLVVDERRRLGYRGEVLTGPNITPLAIAALFLDLAMWPLEYLYGKTGPLSGAERQAVNDHPAVGAAMLPEDTSDLTRLIVRSHHENMDGSGYPDGLVGEEIHVFARIVRIADAFDAATAQHAFRESKSPARALWEMTRGSYQRCYDPVILKVFSKLVHPYPIGAKVELSIGSHAVVVRYGASDPFRPEVIIAFDEHGRRLDRDQIDRVLPLDQYPDVNIVSFRGEDVSDLTDAPMPATDPTVLTKFATLFDSAYP